MANSSLVLLTQDNQPVTTSEIIAEQLGLSHHNVIQNIDKFSKELQTINPLAFQMRKGKPLPQGGFAKSVRFAILNEEQATFVITLSRNSSKVVKFKLALTKAFFEAREYVRKHQEQENLKFDFKKPWYIEQLLSLAKRYTVSEAALKQILDITSRAWKQGYAVAMSKVEKENEGKHEVPTNEETVPVPFSTAEYMLYVAAFLNSKRERYRKLQKALADAEKHIHDLQFDAADITALTEIKMPVIENELSSLPYTERQQQQIGKTLTALKG